MSDDTAFQGGSPSLQMSQDDAHEKLYNDQLLLHETLTINFLEYQISVLLRKKRRTDMWTLDDDVLLIKMYCPEAKVKRSK